PLAALIYILPFFSYSPRHHPDLHSFPTRRSSDLCTMSSRRCVCSPTPGSRRVKRAATRCATSPPARTPAWRRTSASTSHRTPKRSEEHTSELQSPYDLVCRLLLEKKKKQIYTLPH